MELLLKRTDFTGKSTIGNLSIDGQHECVILEDVDRGLDDSMTLEEINRIKINTKTCIPYGRYEIVITMSNRFKKLMPLLLNVKGYAGIRIHPGNVAADTDGCQLPGISKSLDFVGNSVTAYNRLYAKLESALKHEKVFITITK